MYFLFECPSKDETIKKIYDNFNNNKLNSSKLVNYDPYTSKVLGLTNLKYNKEKKINYHVKSRLVSRIGSSSTLRLTKRKEK